MKRIVLMTVITAWTAMSAPMFPDSGVLVSDGAGNVTAVTNAMQDIAFFNAVVSVAATPQDVTNVVLSLAGGGGAGTMITNEYQRITAGGLVYRRFVESVSTNIIEDITNVVIEVWDIPTNFTYISAFPMTAVLDIVDDGREWKHPIDPADLRLKWYSDDGRFESSADGGTTVITETYDADLDTPEFVLSPFGTLVRTNLSWASRWVTETVTNRYESLTTNTVWRIDGVLAETNYVDSAAETTLKSAKKYVDDLGLVDASMATNIAFGAVTNSVAFTNAVEGVITNSVAFTNAVTGVIRGLVDGTMITNETQQIRADGSVWNLVEPFNWRITGRTDGAECGDMGVSLAFRSREEYYYDEDMWELTVSGGTVDGSYESSMLIPGGEDAVRFEVDLCCYRHGWGKYIIERRISTGWVKSDDLVVRSAVSEIAGSEVAKHIDSTKITNETDQIRADGTVWKWVHHPDIPWHVASVMVNGEDVHGLYDDITVSAQWWGGDGNAFGLGSEEWTGMGETYRFETYGYHLYGGGIDIEEAEIKIIPELYYGDIVLLKYDREEFNWVEQDDFTVTLRRSIGRDELEKHGDLALMDITNLVLTSSVTNGFVKSNDVIRLVDNRLSGGIDSTRITNLSSRVNADLTVESYRNGSWQQTGSLLTLGDADERYLPLGSVDGSKITNAEQQVHADLSVKRMFSYVPGGDWKPVARSDGGPVADANVTFHSWTEYPDQPGIGEWEFSVVFTDREITTLFGSGKEDDGEVVAVDMDSFYADDPIRVTFRKEGFDPGGWRTVGNLVLDSDISATNATFSSAVLAIGINTNELAAVHAFYETFADIPISPGGGGVTLLGLLGSIAAALVWLRKKKIDKLTCSGVGDITAEGGTADVAALFSSANSALAGVISGSVTPVLTQGEKIATVGGKDLYAPTGGGGGGDDEKMQTVFDELARMDAFTSTSTEADAFDVAITKLSELLGEDVSELAA